VLLLIAQEAGLTPLVEWNKTQALELKIAELQDALVSQFTADPPLPQAEILTMLKTKKAEGDLPDRCVCVCVAA
jgi:hypothetical protein